MHYSKSYNKNLQDSIEDLTNRFGNFNLSSYNYRNNVRRQITAPLEIEIDPTIMNINKYKDIYPRRFKFGQTGLIYESLDEDSQEYDDVLSLISDDNFFIEDILKVYNPYLKKAFELKRNLQYNSVLPEKLFHGTKFKYIDGICSYNFDWRLYGEEHRFGRGVSFSPKASYAAHYCDKKDTKVMILADVLVKNSSIGSENTIVPPRGYDTTEKENGDVIVKFYDNEFYPAYVIYFQLCNSNRRRRRH